MGQASTALPGIHFSFRNPASLAAFDRTGISVASVLQTRHPEDEAGDSRQNSAELPFVQLAFPVVKGFVLGGGYYRYLDFDGFVDTSTPFQGDSLPMRVTTDGGISVLSPQLARWFSPRLRVGVGVDFYTGSRERLRRIDFDPEVGVATTDSLAYRFGGVGASVGIQTAPLAGLLLGAAYRSGATLDGKLEFAPGVDLDDEDDGDGDDGEGGGDAAGPAREIEVELPAQLALGASYRFGRALLIAADVVTSDWGELAIADETDAAGEEVLEVGLGLEYSFPDRLAFLPEGTVLRTGFRTRNLPQRFAAEEVRERALTVGFGQIVGIGASNLDAAFEVGKRGSLSLNGLEEPFARLAVALSAFELWSPRSGRAGGP